MSDDDLYVAPGLAGRGKMSVDAALFLSKKVAAAQREIVHELRTEGADHTRPETSNKEADKTRANGKSNREDERDTEPRAEASDDTLDGTQQVNITV